MSDTSFNAFTQRGVRSIKRHDLLVDGAFVGGRWINESERAPICDPASGDVVAMAPVSPADRVVEAVDAAHRAFPAWRKQLPLQRGTILRNWASLIRRHGEDLATLITLEQGKPLRESRGEVNYGASYLDWFAGEAERTYGHVIPSHLADAQLITTYQPIGICAAITPWNFPSAMILRKAGAALAAGCPVVVKPAPETPLSALALARLAEEAGVPPGVLAVVNGDAESLARHLIADDRIKAISFTGSTPVGQLITRSAAASIKRVSLELGGHAPFIVFGDADVNHAIDSALDAKFATSGQDCLAVNRLFIQRPLYERFASLLSARVATLRVGHGLDPTTDIGPMTRRSVSERCLRHIQDAEAQGARVLVEGRSQAFEQPFVAPTVLADVADGMLIAREETFGPVVALLPFDEEDEVAHRASQLQAGLAAYVFTNDVRRAHRLAEQLEFGMVGVNTARFTGAPIPFGGWKQSGLGREGANLGIYEFMECKYVCYGDLGRR